MAANVYQMVTDKVVSELENGNGLLWVKPWNSTKGYSYNRISKKPYSLLNQILLGERVGEWATFSQWQNQGGKIKKGEKASFVVFWKMLEKEEINENGEPIKKTIPYLKYSNVFHVSQVDGVEPLETLELNDTIEPIEAAEKIKADYQARENIEIREIIGNDAFYSPTGDYIQIPAKEQYKEISEYYSTMMHEIIHSTGHKSRLNRLHTGTAAAYGKAYGVEELCAELGSIFILNSLGIETNTSHRNSVAYLNGWLNAIKEDSKMIVKAAGLASKACAYVLRTDSNLEA